MWKLEALGMFVHFIIFISVFDIYFRNQISKGIPMNCSGPPLADRLVFIVVNGFGASLFYNHTQPNSVLHTKMKSGAWGTVVGKAPAIFKNSIISMTGGFHNPMSFTCLDTEENEFDHIFNYSFKTYFFGDSTVMKHFGKSSKTWEAKFVLNSENKTDNIIKQVRETFQDVKENKNLHEEGIIFFITLPGVYNSIGTTGGFSQSSLNTIKNELVKIEFLIMTTENFYKDNKTAFILCSDYSIISEKKGTVGDDEAIFIAWGSGVNKTDNVQLDQRDIAVLISSLLGNPIPLSSTGTWPKGCLNITEEVEANGMACNALHLASMAQLAIQDEEHKTLKYINFIQSEETLRNEQYTQDLKMLLGMRKYEDVKEISRKLANTSLTIIEQDTSIVRNLVYYLINGTFIGWIIFLLNLLISQTLKKRVEDRIQLKILRKKIEPWCIGFNTLIILMIIGSTLIVILEDWPLYYTCYCTVPLLIWRDVLNDIQKWSSFIEKMTMIKLIFIIFYSLLYIATTEAITLGMKYTQILAFCTIMVTTILTLKSSIMKEAIHVITAWVLSGLLLIALISLPILDIIVYSSPVTLNAAALIWPIFCSVCAYNMRSYILDFIVMVLCIIHYIASLVTVNMKIFYPHKSVVYIPWLLLGTGFCLPFIGGVNVTNRLQQIAVCLSSILLLISVSYEPIIMFVAYINSFTWYLLSQTKEKTKTLSRYNSYHAIVFTVLIFIVEHSMNTDIDILTIITFRYMPSTDIIKIVLIMLKLYITIFLVFIIFRAIASRSGGDSQFILVNLLLSMCAYRLFFKTRTEKRSEDFLQEVKGHCFIELTQFLLLMTYSLSKILLHTSILKFHLCLGDIIHRLRDISFH